MPAKDIYSKVGFNLPLIPGFDDDMVPSTIATFENVSDANVIPGRQWCESLFIGDASYDVSVQFVFSPLELTKD